MSCEGQREARRATHVVGDARAAVVALGELSVREVTLVEGTSLGHTARLDRAGDGRANRSEQSEAGETHVVGSARLSSGRTSASEMEGREVKARELTVDRTRP